MSPLIGIAISVLPELVKLLAGDKAGTIAGDVAKAVSSATGTSDPAKAKQKLSQDPAVASDLQIKLAQIALEAARIQNEEEDKRRQAELASVKDELQASLENTRDARFSLVELAKDQSELMWVAPLVSLLVCVGFFSSLIFMMFPFAKADASNQLVNITVGALVAAFSTVVNFWLGSSQGSRNKDSASFRLQENLAKAASDRDATTLPSGQKPQSAEPTAKMAGGGQVILHPAVASAQAAGTKADNFEACLAVTLHAEGGYSNDPHDPGGPTNFGITQKVLEQWRGQPVSAEEVKELTRDEAKEIYRANYWLPMNCAKLPDGVDLEVFDFGVNAGPSRSIKRLQRLLGIKEDGSMGPMTLAAVNAIDPKELMIKLANDRQEYYRSLPTFAQFGGGWTRRVSDVQKAAFKMAA
ncbi:MAG TPA: glycosyl hydrolase 108 family protein [Methylocella sp.]|nr:glycosyl hydrolase 108 family protein [Methylocella sp.]